MAADKWFASHVTGIGMHPGAFQWVSDRIHIEIQA